MLGQGGRGLFGSLGRYQAAVPCDQVLRPCLQLLASSGCAGPVAAGAEGDADLCQLWVESQLFQFQSNRALSLRSVGPGGSGVLSREMSGAAVSISPI